MTFAKVAKSLSQKAEQPRGFGFCDPGFLNSLIMRRETPGVAAKSAATSGVWGFATVAKGPTFPGPFAQKTRFNTLTTL